MLNNYKAFRNEMIVRDYLALDRTILANERTLLAYLRSFIGAFSAGLAMLKLFDSLLTNILGSFFIIISPFFVVIGIVRFVQFSKKLKTLTETEEDKNEDK